MTGQPADAAATDSASLGSARAWCSAHAPFLRESALVAVGWAVGAVVFFRRSLFSGFDRIMGIRSDSRLIVFLHEHWWRVVTGEQAWRSAPFFFPQKGTLGYSDTFVLSTVWYVPLRALGADPFLAFQLTFIGSSLVGFFGTWFVLRRMLGAGRALSLALSLVTTFGSALFAQSLHPQLLSVHWLPLVVLLAWRAARSRDRTGVIAAVGAGLLAGAIALSTFYVAWFALVAGAVFVVVSAGAFVVMEGRSSLVGVLRRHARAGVAAGGGFLLMMIPFAFVYGQAAGQGGQRSLDFALAFTRPPTGLFDVGRSNVVWGWAMPENKAGLFGQEFLVGFAPVFFVLALVACVVILRRPTDAPARRACAIGTVAAFLVLVALPLDLGRLSPWRLAWVAIPGARAIRVPVRAWVVAVGIGGAVIAAGLGGVVRRARAAAHPRAARAILLAVLALLVVEQVSRDSRWDVRRSTEQGQVGSVPAPPRDCDAFFLLPPSWSQDPAQLPVDAMMVAMATGLPTVNGYSGMAPKGYDLDPASPDYATQVVAWLDRSGAAGLTICSYEPATGVWLVAAG